MAVFNTLLGRIMSNPRWGEIQGSLSKQTDLTNALGQKIDASQKGAANGIAPLGADTKINSSYLPAIAITDIFTVANQAAMLALTAEKGDVVIRTDLNKSFILSTNSPSTLVDWKELLTPTDAVQSINGKVGVVTLVPEDIAGFAAVATSGSYADLT